MHQLGKALLDPTHPYYKFSTGNRETLDEGPKKLGLSTRDALLAFHKKYYSSHIMGLALLGNQSLDDLEEIVRSRFSEVERKDVDPPVHTGHPQHGEHCQQYIEVVPVRAVRQVYGDLSLFEQIWCARGCCYSIPTRLLRLA
jgi:insulysin